MAFFSHLHNVLPYVKVDSYTSQHLNTQIDKNKNKKQRKKKQNKKTIYSHFNLLFSFSL